MQEVSCVFILAPPTKGNSLQGLKVVEPFIKSRVIRLSVEDDFVKVILSPNVPIVDLSLEVRPQFENLGKF